MYKNPRKARFIIAAPKCSVKPLSKTVTAALKGIYKQIENCNFINQYYSGVKLSWPVQINQAVIDIMHKLD